MTPPDTREAMQIALFNARRLIRDLGMLAPDTFGVALVGRIGPRDVRDVHISNVARIVVALESALEKELTT